jgi:hypothetical protein
LASTKPPDASTPARRSWLLLLQLHEPAKQQLVADGSLGDDPAVSGINGRRPVCARFLARRSGPLPAPRFANLWRHTWKLAEVIPKVSFPSVKFTYTFDLGDEWTPACEVLASDDQPDFSRAPAYVRTSLSVPIFGGGTISRPIRAACAMTTKRGQT